MPICHKISEFGCIFVARFLNWIMEHIEKVIDEKIYKEKRCVKENNPENRKKLFIESYGCQMNMNDSEIVASILDRRGF